MDSLTIPQRKIVDFLEVFIKSEDTFTTIAGYAGTGKTYTLREYISKKFKNKAVVTAFTHKAVMQISKQLHVPGKTVHSLLGLSPNMKLDSFNPNNPTFTIQGVEAIQGYKLVVVDECSQIGQELYSYLIERAKRYNVKIIFTGDPCQLPPIKEIISPTFKVANMQWLTHIIRQSKENPILNVLTLLREDIFNSTSKALNYLQDNPVSINDIGEGYTVMPPNSFNRKLLEYVNKPESTEIDDYVKYTAFTREMVDNMNFNLHKHKYDFNNIPQEEQKQLYVGEILTAHKTIVDNFMVPLIVNSLDYIITDCMEFTTADDIEVFAIKLKCSLQPQVKNSTFYLVKHTTENIERLVNLLYPLYEVAMHSRGRERKEAWQKYFSIKDQYLIIFDVEYEDLKVEKDITYGYGLTTYKVQGSTYDTCFTDLLNITCWDNTFGKWISNSRYNPYAILNRNKHMYVALSRASKHNYIKLC